MTENMLHESINFPIWHPRDSPSPLYKAGPPNPGHFATASKGLGGSVSGSVASGFYSEALFRLDLLVLLLVVLILKP